MCKRLLKNVMCVCQKKRGMDSCKSIMAGVLLGVTGGIVLGMWVNSEKGKQFRDKILCKCTEDKCVIHEND